MKNPLHVLYAIFEASPFVQTGGLGDVGGALPTALSRKGCDVRVMLPKFGSIPAHFRQQMESVTHFYVPLGWRNEYCGIELLEWKGVPYYFLDNEYYFRREKPYGYFDDGERIAFFSKAVTESIRHLPDFPCHILHCNDWHTALSTVYLREFYCGLPQYDGIRTVFTVHNLHYQGIFGSQVLGDVLGLNGVPAAADQLTLRGDVNFMKGALCYSDILTTVSPTYAKEIRNSYFGEKLEDLFNSRWDRLYGILNGIDTEDYDPARDQALAAPYDAAHFAKKKVNKLALQRELNLEVNAEIPLLVMVSRLTEQKGLDLLLRILDELLLSRVEVAILGTGDAKYENALREIAWRHPGRMNASLFFETALSRRFYAGADVLMMPSRFEPCGLSQMIAMRYGTLPVVRETGGLRDTVQSYNKYTGEGTGFSFANFNAHELLFTLKEAARVYREEPKAWRRMVARAMAADFSWNRPAQTYLEIYRRLVPG